MRKLALFVALSCSVVLAQDTLHVPQTSSVLFLWNASPASDIGGYIFGQKRNNFNPPVTETNIGNITSYVKSGLAVGVYYFDIKAFDTSNNQSDWSDSTVIVSVDTVIVPDDPGGGGTDPTACDTANVTVFFYRPTTLEGGAPLEYSQIRKFQVLVKAANADWDAAVTVADSIPKGPNPIKWCGYLSFAPGTYHLATKCVAYVNGLLRTSDIGKPATIVFPLVPQTIKPASMRKPTILRP